MNKTIFCKQLAKQIATLGPIGSLPAPGTLATVITLFIIYLLNQYQLTSTQTWLALCTIITGVSYAIITHALPLFQKNNNPTDPSEIVLDEVAGCLITFLGITISSTSLFLGFLLFRFFDIAKPLLIKHCEKLPGATGIMLDDIAAAVMANFLLRIIMLYLT